MRKKTKTYHRLNHQIQASEIRLLDGSGKQIGIYKLSEALKMAGNAKKDLVEIAPKAKPPVVKLIDYKKFKYLESKKKRKEKKKSKQSLLKEIRLSPYMGEHDLKTRVDQAKEFLKEGNQLKLSLVFKGRQIVHKEFGYKVIEKAIDDLKGIGKIIKRPSMERRTLVAILSPDK